VQLHETLTQFSDIIRSYEVLQYDVEGLHTRLKLRVIFHDESQLYSRETVLEGQYRKYAYHWQDAAGQLRIRWDNAAHWPQIETYPHHQHVGNEIQVEASEATTLEEVLTCIRTRLQKS
jgi:hypothetical protein